MTTRLPVGRPTLCGDDEIRDFIGPGTRVVDLRGRLAIPAFGDAHVHPVQGGLESLRCDLTGHKTRAGYGALRASGRHHIAHLQFIRPADVERFAPLGVIASFQPLWACKDEQNDRLTLPHVGLARANWQYRIGSLLRLGTRLAFGSDWPVSSADPLQELHVAGTLEPGKVADVAVLDQDLFTIAPNAIGDTRVALTIAAGQVVHGDE
jgi:predicted amidohydrolase YtcJ